MAAPFHDPTQAAVCSIHTCHHFDDEYVPDYLVAPLVGGVDLSEKGAGLTSLFKPKQPNKCLISAK